MLDVWLPCGCLERVAQLFDLDTETRVVSALSKDRAISTDLCLKREECARYLVDPASSHMLVSKIKPCMSKYKPY